MQHLNITCNNIHIDAPVLSLYYWYYSYHTAYLLAQCHHYWVNSLTELRYILTHDIGIYIIIVLTLLL